MYIHELKDWPDFQWNMAKLADLLAEVRYAQGRFLGQMAALGFPLCQETTFRILTQDVLKTSEIEGERLDVDEVRSSIAKRMGIEIGLNVRVGRAVDGLVEILLDATRNYETPLTKDRLFGWHAALFPTGHSGMNRISVGNWRGESSGAMHVVSGPIGREKVHYEAPSYDRVDREMERFIVWFNREPDMDLVVKSALAHFWFVTIHPFDDGNGRIARAIADMMLARSENSSQRFYSMSSQILLERNGYYEILERTQKGSLDVTDWIEWFLNCLKGSIEASSEMLNVILVKAHFWEVHANESFNERQRLLINRLFDGFLGKLTSSKWAKISKTSQDTALRDINDLLERNILIKDDSGGRNTSYHLNLNI